MREKSKILNKLIYDMLMYDIVVVQDIVAKSSKTLTVNNFISFYISRKDIPFSLAF